MADLKSLQADARAKLEAELREDIRNLQNYNFDVGETVGRFSDALVLSTILAVKEEVLPKGVNPSIADVIAAFDSLLGGDAKRV